MSVYLFCLGQSQAVTPYCYRCQHTPQEYIECPHFTALARHEIVVEDSEDSLEARIRRWGGIMGLGDVEE